MMGCDKNRLVQYFKEKKKNQPIHYTKPYIMGFDYNHLNRVFEPWIEWEERN